MVMFHQEYWSAQFMYDDPLGPFGTSDWDNWVYPKLR
jgi:hypothetical protein